MAFDQVPNTGREFLPVEQASNSVRKQLVTLLTFRPRLYQWAHLAWQVSIAFSILCMLYHSLHYVQSLTVPETHHFGLAP